MATNFPNYVSISSATQGQPGREYICTVDGIDGTATGQTGILTVPAGFKFVLNKAVIRLTGLAGAATVGHVKIQNITDTVDIVGDTTLTGLTAITLTFPILPSGATAFVPAGKVVGVNVTTAFTVATVVTLSVDLIGYLV